MSLPTARDRLHAAELSDKAGREIYDLAAEMFPVCRSLSGPGVRETLGILKRYIPLVQHSVPSGERVFDWTVPPEWTVREALFKVPAGN